MDTVLFITGFAVPSAESVLKEHLLIRRHSNLSIIYKSQETSLKTWICVNCFSSTSPETLVCLKLLLLLLSCFSRRSTLCDPRDGRPPGTPVPGILQARTLEWVVLKHHYWLIYVFWLPSKFPFTSRLLWLLENCLDLSQTNCPSLGFQVEITTSLKTSIAKRKFSSHAYIVAVVK